MNDTPKLQRFFAYKTSGGVFQEQNDYSHIRLFTPCQIQGNHYGYSSNSGRNVLVTGVATPYTSFAGEENGSFLADSKMFFDRIQKNLFCFFEGFDYKEVRKVAFRASMICMSRVYMFNFHNLHNQGPSNFVVERVMQSYGQSAENVKRLLRMKIRSDTNATNVTEDMMRAEFLAHLEERKDICFHLMMHDIYGQDY